MVVSPPKDSAVPPLIDRAQRLLSGDSELLRHMADAAGSLAVNLTLAGLILVGTIWASGWLSGLASRAIARAHRHRPADTTLQTFTASLVRYFVIVVGLIAVLQQLGVKATSVIAVLGAASLAIGLALQGALGNVAAGVMLLILRPYRVGDRVEINGKFGVVKGLDLFSTRLADLDNLNVFVPNGKAFGEIIVNYTSTSSHRIQVDILIDYQDDVDKALELMLDCARADARVVEKPAPWAKLTSLEASGVQVSLRAWVLPATFTDTRFDLLKAVKDRLEAAGFSFPYPHQVAVESRPFQRPAARAPRAKAATAARRPRAAKTSAPGPG